MGFNKQRFGLFFSLPPDEQDWQNLQVSRVRLVMIMLEHAQAPILARLRDMGCRVVLRVNEGDYYNDEAPERIRNQVLFAMRACPVEAVIVGNEPDNAMNLTYGSVGWGQEFAYVHRRRFDAVRKALQSMAVKVISPALIMRSISEDEAPVPGQISWREILTLPDGGFGYLDAEGNGGHIYCYGWDGPVDEIRFKFALKHLANIWHKELWIDEVGIAGGHTQVEKMRAYIEMGEILLHNRGLGSRVGFLCPFISNGDPGNPPAWSPGFLIRDPRAYEELGRWVSL